MLSILVIFDFVWMVSNELFPTRTGLKPILVDNDQFLVLLFGLVRFLDFEF